MGPVCSLAKDLVRGRREQAPPEQVRRSRPDFGKDEDLPTPALGADPRRGADLSLPTPADEPGSYRPPGDPPGRRVRYTPPPSSSSHR